MLDGDEKEGVGWTDGFLLREPVPENALLGSASQSRLIKLGDDGGKNPEERDVHYMMLFIADLQKRERGYHNITPCIPHSSICHTASKQTITNNQ